jgi:hypothetical protein
VDETAGPGLGRWAAWLSLWISYMATMLIILLVVGYALSVWSLKRQEHFAEPPPGIHRRGAAARRRVRRQRRFRVVR